MADISAYHTQQTGTQVKTAATGSQHKALAAKGGLFGTTPAGMSFMDMIFSRLTAEDAGNTNKPGETTEGEAALTSQPDYTGHSEPLTAQQTLENILADGTVPAGDTDGLIDPGANTEGEAQDKANIQMVPARKKLAAFLESLVAGLPQENKPVVLDIAPGHLKQMLGKLQAEGDGEGSPALIATGLTPEKLTELLSDLADGNEEGEAFIIGMVKILPTEARKEAVFMPRAMVLSGAQQPSPDGSSTPATGQTEQDAEALTAKVTSLTSGDNDPALQEEKFDDILRVLEKAQSMGKKTGQQGSDKGIENAMRQVTKQADAANAAPTPATIPGTPPAPGEMSGMFSMDSIFPEGLDFGYGAQNGQSITGPAQLASLVSHANHASQPHPATQTVAATIAKATTSSESRNITIQLDPPDLGRVSIRLEFQKDSNTLKAMIASEKPETHMMLQRDAHVLERALQDAGLDADGSSLSFELAQDGNMFDHDQHHTGGNSGGSGGEAGDGEETGTELEIIETTMDWYADPDTGLMRYSALI